MKVWYVLIETPSGPVMASKSAGSTDAAIYDNPDEPHERAKALSVVLDGVKVVVMGPQEV